LRSYEKLSFHMAGQTYRFAEFELSSGTGELRTKDTCIRLQEKPLQLLLALVEKPQQVVTRSKLRECMWDHDTFVNYELGINVAIKKVRDALGDSAENPTFIETLAKKGYRFLVPVEVVDSEIDPQNGSTAAFVAADPTIPTTGDVSNFTPARALLAQLKW